MFCSGGIEYQSLYASSQVQSVNPITRLEITRLATLATLIMWMPGIPESISKVPFPR